jgi:hypothetical protein
MNPWSLSAADLVIWGLVAHLVADWLLQNDWMATNKAKRADLGEIPGDGLTRAPSRMHPYTLWFVRHPAAYVHAGIHGLLLAVAFGWAAAPLALAHLVIDTRAPVAWWSRLIRQTQPVPTADERGTLLVDLGTFVRMWNDQVWHVACLAIAALVVSGGS